MGKKGSWISAIKNAFRSPSKEAKGDSKPLKNDPKKAEDGLKKDSKKDAKEKKRWSFRKHSEHEKGRPVVAALPGKAPPSNEQTKHALAVAAATTAAAEAAVAAAKAAAEVVRLATTTVPHSADGSHSPSPSYLEWSAIKIQTAFRGYLARRTLRSLRGMARLEALLQSHTVQKQAMVAYKCTEALLRVRIQVQARRVQMCEKGLALQQKLYQMRKEESSRKFPPLDDGVHPQVNWDQSIHTLAEVEMKKLSKQEAAVKRERAMAYAYSHQLRRTYLMKAWPMLINAESNWGWSWLGRWIATSSWESPFNEKDYSQGKPKKVRQMKCATVDEEQQSTISAVTSFRSFGSRMLPRRSSLPGSSIRDDESLKSCFSAIPNYMNPTESTKAKARSVHSSNWSRTMEREGSTSSRCSAAARRRLTYPTSEVSFGQSLTPRSNRSSVFHTQRSPSIKGGTTFKVEKFGRTQLVL